MTDLIVINPRAKHAPLADTTQPDPGKVTKGPLKTRSWNFDTQENGRLFTGVWESTPGKMNVAYDEWEFCHIITGKAVLCNTAGKTWTFKAGDAFVIPAGFTGSWETVEKLRKHYVILLPEIA